MPDALCWERRWGMRALIVGLLAVLTVVAGSLACADEQDAPWATAWGWSRIAQSTNITLTAAHRGVMFDCSAAVTISLPAAATIGAGYHFIARSSGTSSPVTIDPSGVETISCNGFLDTTLKLVNQSAVVVCTGSAWVVAASSGLLGPGAGGGLTAVTVDTTLTARDNGRLIQTSTGSPIITLPTGGAVASGWTCQIVNGVSGGTTTVTTQGADRILVNGALVVSTTLTYGQALWLSGISGVFHVIGSGGASLTGAAGGDLSGTYPNPTVAKANGTAFGTTTTGVGTYLGGTGSLISSLTMSGDATLNNGVVTLKNTGPGAGSFTNSNITIDAQGRVTAASSGTGISLLYSQYTTVAMTNTSTQTSLMTGTATGSRTLSAGYFNAVGKAVRVVAHGTLGTTATPNIAMILIAGSTSSGSTVPSPNNASLNPWTYEGTITCSTTGASGTLVIAGTCVFGGPAGTSAVSGGDVVSGAINLTSTVALDLQFAFGVANPSNTLNCYSLYIQPLN